MDQADAFLAQGFEQAGFELADIISGANLHLKPETVTRSMAARIRARLKALETILRRLILLMAMALDLAPAKPRVPQAGASLPEGVEDVTASFRMYLKTRRFMLMPPAMRAPGHFPETRPTRPPGPVPAAPLTAWAATLYRVLKNPEPAARRLARTVARMQKRGEGRPYCRPMARRHRMQPELALVAGVLPGLVNRALEAWNDTG